MAIINEYDVIIIGLGAMGSAGLYQLSKSDKKVLGIDQFSPPHMQGSSHGDTRITRTAIGEGSEYTSMALRAQEIWRELEKISQQDLLKQVGCLIMAEEDNNFMQNTIKSANEFGIAHQLFPRESLQRDYPQFKTTTEVGILEPTGGYLLPEECIRTQLALAQQNGAQAMINTKVDSLSVSPDGKVTVTINKNNTFQNLLAEQVVITSGAWINDFLPANMQTIFKVYRQVLHWFDIADKSTSFASFEPQAFPTFIWEFPEMVDDSWGVYGFPAINGPKGGLKIACEQFNATTTPATLERVVSKEESEIMYDRFVHNRLSGLQSKVIEATVCMYTNTADSNFVIDRSPQHGQILLVSPCSGHGFKHSAAIGEIISDLVLHGKSKLAIDSFSLSRL